jgi:hypothetical protein
MTGATGGRADKLPVSVPAGAFIVPADIVSALGQGNTMAGMQEIERRFGKPSAHGRHEPVQIKISDGEVILTPEQVTRIGGGSMEAGHAKLDQFVQQIRQANIQHLASLPPPSR